MNGINQVVRDRMLRELKKVEHLHSRVSICEHLWSRSMANILIPDTDIKQLKEFNTEYIKMFEG